MRSRTRKRPKGQSVPFKAQASEMLGGLMKPQIHRCPLCSQQISGRQEKMVKEKWLELTDEIGRQYKEATGAPNDPYRTTKGGVVVPK